MRSAYSAAQSPPPVWIQIIQIVRFITSLPACVFRRFSNRWFKAFKNPSPNRSQGNQEFVFLSPKFQIFESSKISNVQTLSCSTALSCLSWASSAAIDCDCPILKEIFLVSLEQGADKKRKREKQDEVRGDCHGCISLYIYTYVYIHIHISISLYINIQYLYIQIDTHLEVECLLVSCLDPPQLLLMRQRHLFKHSNIQKFKTSETFFSEQIHRTLKICKSKTGIRFRDIRQTLSISISIRFTVVYIYTIFTSIKNNGVCTFCASSMYVYMHVWLCVHHNYI